MGQIYNNVKLEVAFGMPKAALFIAWNQDANIFCLLCELEVRIDAVQGLL